MFTTKAIVSGSLTIDIILGKDLFKDHQCTIEMGRTFCIYKKGNSCYIEWEVLRDRAVMSHSHYWKLVAGSPKE